MPVLGFKTIYFRGNLGSYATYDEGYYGKGLLPNWFNVTAGDHRFVDNSNGTVTDRATGLIWLQKTNTSGAISSWLDALDYCYNLTDNGTTLTDGSTQGMWRLPNYKEFVSLLTYGYNPTLPTNPFSSIVVNYWTSSTYLASTDYVYQLTMVTGVFTVIAKTSPSGNFYAWPVRN